VTKVQSIVVTFETVERVPDGVQVTDWLFGSVIAQETAPVGWTALTTPTIVDVRVVVPPGVGFAELVTEIVGVWRRSVAVNALLETAE